MNWKNLFQPRDTKTPAVPNTPQASSVPLPQVPSQEMGDTLQKFVDKVYPGSEVTTVTVSRPLTLVDPNFNPWAEMARIFAEENPGCRINMVGRKAQISLNLQFFVIFTRP